MSNINSHFRPSQFCARLSLLILGCIVGGSSYSQITMTNPVVENILKGNYDPSTYAPTNLISDKDLIVGEINQGISADSLKSYLIKLETFGNRNTGSDTNSIIRGIGATRKWIKSKFHEFSADNENRLQVSYLDFNSNICGVNKHKNVLAVLPGLDTSRKDILVVEAHMDSRCEVRCDTSCYAPGMDDNGSGTALVIELTRVLSKLSFDRTIVFTTVTGEEQGLLGGVAMSEYLRTNDIDLLACLNNDVVGGVECGVNSSPPSCSPAGSIDSVNLRVFSFSPANDTDFVSIHKQLARFVKLQQIEEVNPVTGFNANLNLQIREDRNGRGGDHIPFRQRQMRAIRFTSSHEHGNGSGNAPDRQHTTTDVLGYDLSIPPDGILDTFLVDFNYLKRNTLTNGINLALLANSPPIPEPIYERTDFDNIYAIRFDASDTLYDHRIGVRKRNSNDLYFDTVLTFEKDFIYFYEIEPQGNVQLHAMNFDGVYESIPSVHADEEYLSVKNEDELKCQEYYPNPSHGNLNLRWKCSLELNDIEVLFYNQAGQLLKEFKPEKASGSEEYQMDVSNLPPGYYQVVTIINQEEKYVESLIIQ